MASVASQFIEEVTAHAQSDSLEDAREICADGTHFPNNLPNSNKKQTLNTDIRSTYFHQRAFICVYIYITLYARKLT